MYNRMVSPRRCKRFLFADRSRRVSTSEGRLLSLARHGYTPTPVVLPRENMYTIYALVDPRTYQICYIGQTQNHPTVRLESHLEKEGGNKGKWAWFCDLRNVGTEPSVVILEYAEDHTTSLLTERLWIERGRRHGWPLLNLVNRPIERTRKQSIPGDEQPTPKKERPTSKNGVVFTEDGWLEWTVSNHLPDHPELLTLDAQGRGVGIGDGHIDSAGAFGVFQCREVKAQGGHGHT